MQMTSYGQPQRQLELVDGMFFYNELPSTTKAILLVALLLPFEGDSTWELLKSHFQI